MALVDLVMPKLGESIMEATVLKWRKQPGDRVEKEETVLEIATDKVDSDVPSTAAGIIREILFKENDVVPVGAAIARIETEGASSGSAQAPQTPAQQPAPQPSPQPAASPAREAASVPYQPQPVSAPAPAAGVNRFYSPLVLTIAGSENVSMSELEKIPGTGNEGRVTKKDILDYVTARKSGGAGQQASEQPSSPAQQVQEPQPQQSQPQQAQPETVHERPAEVQENRPEPKPEKDYGANVEIREMDRMRKLIAKHMVDSVRTSPHVTSFVEADVTNMVLWREKVKHDFERRENTRITFTPLFIDCLVRVMKRFPMVNSSIDGDKIIIRKDINIGMATALPDGNLIVPVIRNADYLNLVGLSKAVNKLADAARSNKLKPDDTSGGTFTITNVGTFGSLMGTPIINQPQVAILAVGAIKKRPVVIETGQGDTIGIRHMMYLSLSYDHRIVDGSLGAQFLTEVARAFEAWNPDRNLL